MDTPSKIRFISKNRHKHAEAAKILAVAGVEVVMVTSRIDEIQSENMEAIVRDKVTKAFVQVGRPLFIEQTGLYLKQLNDLPGGLTQVFWDGLQAERFCNLFGAAADNCVLAKTMIGYTEGKRIHLFSGEISGKISTEPRGSRDFQWDCVFQPAGFEQTFAEMGDKKNEISMRRKALDAFVNYLREPNNG